MASAKRYTQTQARTHELIYRFSSPKTRKDAAEALRNFRQALAMTAQLTIDTHDLFPC